MDNLSIGCMQLKEDSLSGLNEEDNEARLARTSAINAQGGKDARCIQSRYIQIGAATKNKSRS